MKKNKIVNILHYQVPPQIINVILLICAFILSCFLFVGNTEAVAATNSLKSFVYGMDTSFATFISLTIIYVIVLCILGNQFIGYIFMEILTICWGIANRIVLNIRDQFITIAELNVLGEALEVDIDKKIFYSPIIMEMIIIGIINGFLLWLLIRNSKKYYNWKEKKKKYFIIRILLILAMLVTFIAIHAKGNQNVYNNINAHRKSGCVVWFCQSLFGNATEIVSNEEAQIIYDNFKNAVAINENIVTKYPNIIVIMSEAFWDTNNLKGIVETSENPMDKYYKLVEDSITGQVAVNIFGGGTVRSEFEFLTGLNVRYLRMPNCYNAYYSKAQESMVTYLKELGYYAIAMHPYAKEYYGREMGYSNIGFDVFYSDAEFYNRDMFHGYVSDMSLTKEIIDRYEEHKEINPEQPIFTFALSVQNHVYDMRYFDKKTGSDGCSGITVSLNDGQNGDEVFENLEEYYNGMSATMDALEELMIYFQECDEDTIIVLFGDHAPSFVKQICDTEGRETEMNLYRTPYMIWTNYENDYESFGDISLPYLSTVLIDYLNLPKPNYYYVNRYMLEHYPINTQYEQLSLDSLEEQKIIDMMSILSTIEKRFPKEEMALSFWKIVE